MRCPLGIVEKKHGGFCCFYCGSKPTCIAFCHSQIYYVIPEDIRYTRLAIHLGKHMHEVADGESMQTRTIVRDLVKEHVQKLPNAGQKKIEKEVARELIMNNLLPSDGSVLEMMTTEKISSVLDQLQPLTNQRRS